jgi:hypothetical protein
MIAKNKMCQIHDRSATEIPFYFMLLSKIFVIPEKKLFFYRNSNSHGLIPVCFLNAVEK